jgi:hypothetical protein
MKINFKTLKIGNISGTYYKSKRKTNTLVIYGIGAPIPPDNGTLPDAPILLNFGVDLFVPDYIGYGRSGGSFTPKNCLKTFLVLFEQYKTGCVGNDIYNNSQIKLKYKRVIFIGRSFGGTYIPVLPRFNNKIKELAIIYPVVDSKSCGSIKGEESNTDFLRTMFEGGYKYLYRGITNKVWEGHLENKDDLSPMDNIKYLENAKLFIGHGKKDTCVHFSKSLRYYKKISQHFPSTPDSFKLNLYTEGDHSSRTSNLAVKDFMVWLGFKEL